MAETSKNKIYYNDNENSVADVLADMKKMAESTDEAIEKSKYNDAAIKKSISDVEKKQVEKNIEQDSKIVELQTEKTKLEKELKEMQEDFYQNSIRGQASGEYIHVEDSSNCRAKIGIGGNSEQEVVTDNLFNNTWKQGIIASETGVEIDSTENIRSSSVEVHASHLYSISRSIYTSYMSFRFYTKDGVYLGNQLTEGIMTASNTDKRMNANESSMTFTITNANVARMRIVDNSNNLTTKYTLTTDTINPDYPSEIKTVGSNVNMFNKDNYIKSKLYINKNENKFSEASMGKSFIFDISKYNKLTISKVSSERFGVFASVDYPQKDGVGTYLQDVATKTTSFTYDFTEFNYLVVMYYLTSETITEQQILDSIKLEKGTVATPYSKFGQGCVKVTKCNKNIWNLGNKGNNSGDISFPLKSGKYTLSFKKKRISNSTITNAWVYRYAYIRFYDKNDTLLSSIKDGMAINLTANQTSDRQIIDFTAPENTAKMIVNFSNNNGDNNNNTESIEIQLEGEKATSFEQHQEQSYIMPIQQPMRSIGDIRDTFIKKENKWYERHYIARRIFNGIANKFNSKHSSIYTDTRGLYQLNLPGKILGTNGSVAYGKSNYLKYKNGNAMDAIYQDCLWWENTSNYNYASIPFLSLTEANEWLVKLNDNGNPFYIDYVLAEPLDIECTEEQSNILDELSNARTYKNVTNITTDSKAILDLDYAKDQETQNQKMQNEIDEIKQLLSTTQTSAMLLDNLQKEVESEVE